MQTHAIGKPVLRLEDGPLIRGRGRFVDDLKFPDMLEAAFLRSPHAHAAIRGIDTQAARRLPGVQAVFTVADLAPLLTDERLPLQFRTDQLPADVAPVVLAKDEVAFVGEAVGLVIAQSRAIAEDAAALVDVDYEPLPAISDCRAALRPGAAARPSRQGEQPAHRVSPILRRYCRGVRARAASRRGKSQAASRRRAFASRAAARLRSMTSTKTG